LVKGNRILSNDKGKDKGQLEEAKLISQYRSQNKTFNEIGNLLNKNPEACRSTLRRYQSNLNEDINILNILDNEINDDIFNYKRSEKICQQIDEYERSKKYGTYLCLSDIHSPFESRKTIKQILLDPDVKKIDTCIVNGDLFQMDVASKFPVDRDELIELSLDKGSEILEVLANQFKKVYIVEGNHDRHCKRELLKSVKNGLKRLIKDVSPIKTVIDELYDKNKIDNIEFTYGNELMIGNVVFAHPDYFSSVPGQTVIGMIDTYLTRYKDLSAVIIGHTHQLHYLNYKGVAGYETGSLCKEMDYIRGAIKHRTPWVLGYGIFTIKPDGDIDTKNSQVISIK
jgi:predicted phosphodiesterase